jgi:hypothetical protein
MFAVLVVFFAICNLAVFSIDVKPIYTGEIQLQGEFPDVVKTVTKFGDDPLPASWDWRTTGFMTTDLNQHIPVYW